MNWQNTLYAIGPYHAMIYLLIRSRYSFICTESNAPSNCYHLVHRSRRIHVLYWCTRHDCRHSWHGYERLCPVVLPRSWLSSEEICFARLPWTNEVGLGSLGNLIYKDARMKSGWNIQKRLAPVRSSKMTSVQQAILKAESMLKCVWRFLLYECPLMNSNLQKMLQERVKKLTIVAIWGKQIMFLLM